MILLHAVTSRLASNRMHRILQTALLTRNTDLQSKVQYIEQGKEFLSVNFPPPPLKKTKTYKNRCKIDPVNFFLKNKLEDDQLEFIYFLGLFFSLNKALAVCLQLLSPSPHLDRL